MRAGGGVRPLHRLQLWPDGLEPFTGQFARQPRHVILGVVLLLLHPRLARVADLVADVGDTSALIAVKAPSTTSPRELGVTSLRRDDDHYTDDE